jgi:hypothetical protein
VNDLAVVSHNIDIDQQLVLLILPGQSIDSNTLQVNHHCHHATRTLYCHVERSSSSYRSQQE